MVGNGGITDNVGLTIRFQTDSFRIPNSPQAKRKQNRGLFSQELTHKISRSPSSPEYYPNIYLFFFLQILFSKQSCLVGSDCTLINDGSHTSSTHNRKLPETMSGTYLYITKTQVQVFTLLAQKQVQFALHVHQLWHHVGARTCANCTSFAPLFAPSKVQSAPFLHRR